LEICEEQKKKGLTSITVAEVMEAMEPSLAGRDISVC
jgi:hypothetical protein